MQTKRALLIGVDAYAHVRPLKGCVNDVHLMRSVLTETFGFPESNITMLVNDQATQAGVLAGFDALIAATTPDDIVVIHYAGHGSQMTDREGDEPSGMDSTILPIDSGRDPHENLDITDDEIHLKLKALGEKTSFTTLIFDSCHSGTITRDVSGAETRSVEPDRRPVSELPPSPIPPGRLPRTRSGASGWMPLGDKHVLISGCRDEEKSSEYFPPEGGGTVAHGALTYFLCQQLRQATPGTTYRDVFERAAARVNGENAEQHPQIEGQADREVFGVTDVTPATFLRVAARQDSIVVLAAGAAHGLTVGSKYAVFPQGTKDPEGTPIGEIEVSDVHVVTADARVVREDPANAIGPDARAFETEHAHGNFRLSVQLMPGPDEEAHVAAMRSALEQSSRLAIVTGDPAPAARIYLLPARTEVPDSAAVPQAGRLAEPQWAVVGTAGDLLMRLKSLGAEKDVVEGLEKVARYRQVLAAENPDPRSRFRGRFSLDLLRKNSSGGWVVAQPAANGGDVVFDAGEMVNFRITSHHDAPVYVALIDLGLSGAVEPVRQKDRLAANTTYDLGGDRGLGPLKFPDDYPFAGPMDSVGEAEGLETVKLFVTETPADFTAVRQKSTRSAENPSSALTTLLSDPWNDKATRDLSEPVGEEDWTTVTRSFVLRRRVKKPLAPGANVSVDTATLAGSGISGTVALDAGRTTAARGVTDAFQRALESAGIETKRTLEVSDTRALSPASRGVSGPPTLALTLKAPGEGYGQMVLAVDEAGLMSWCLPDAAPGGASTRGLDDGTRTYQIPADVPEEQAHEADTRGLISAVGTKILKELVFPLIDPVLGEVGPAFIGRAEHQMGPCRARTFTPDDFALKEAQEIDQDGWTRLASGRALLLLHGTMSRTHLAFHQLPGDYVETLHNIYGGRVFAFDHFTFSDDPLDNVRKFVAAMPDDIDLTLDIVSHSRGGLVSRVLSEKQSELSLGARRIRVGKAVFVGVPSAGTALADSSHVTQAFDVFTNLMNLLPDNGITEVLTFLVNLLKPIAVGALDQLVGLHAMQPGSEFMQALNTGDRTGDTTYFAVASNVTPVDAGLKRMVVRYGLNTLFDGANDYVVPADGVFAANGSAYFPIDNPLVLKGAGAAGHTQYFRDAQVRDQILRWLKTS